MSVNIIFVLVLLIGDSGTTQETKSDVEKKSIKFTLSDIAKRHYVVNSSCANIFSKIINFDWITGTKV